MELHTTADGRQMLIAEMEDHHLQNCIKLLCRKIETCRELLESPDRLQGNAVIQALNPHYSTESCKKRANELIRDSHETLQPYCLEASLRGLEITELLREAYGRKTGIPSRMAMAINLFLKSSSGDELDQSW